jgi:hypothetical protein
MDIQARHLSGSTEETQITSQDSRSPTEIRTEPLPNVNLDC